jgi:hypothetical protein
MKKAELRKTIYNLWSNDTAPGDIKFARDCLRKNRDALQKIYNEDPAALLYLYGSEVRRALEASDVSPALPLLESDAVLKRQTTGRPKDPWRHPVTALISFFANNRKPAMSAAAILMLLGAVFIYRSLTLRQESTPDSVRGTTAAEGLKKNHIYDKDIRRETATNADVRVDYKPASADGKKSSAFRNAIATNLVADGDKVIHYRMESGTEIIFVTWLD